MGKFTFIFILILSALSLFSQNFAPIGATWHYQYENLGVSGYIKIQSISDTIIDEYNCKKLNTRSEIYNFINEQFYSSDLGNDYIYSDSDKVYIYRNGLFYTLYDFSADVGDSWEIPYSYDTWEDCDTLGSVQVVAKGDTMISDQNLRYIRLENNNADQGWFLMGLIIERIGSVESYFFPEQNCLIDYYEGGNFRCYHDDFFNIETGNVPCDFIVGIDKIEIEKQQVQLTYKSEFIRFKSLNGQTISSLVIFDISGQEIKSLRPEQSEYHLFLTDLKCGIYIYKAIVGNLSETGKLVIQ